MHIYIVIYKCGWMWACWSDGPCFSCCCCCSLRSRILMKGKSAADVCRVASRRDLPLRLLLAIHSSLLLPSAKLCVLVLSPFRATSPQPHGRVMCVFLIWNGTSLILQLMPVPQCLPLQPPNELFLMCGSSLGERGVASLKCWLNGACCNYSACAAAHGHLSFAGTKRFKAQLVVQ